jgi:hypothetical protein
MLWCAAIKGAMCFSTKMEKWHHFHSPSEPEVQNMGPTWPMEWDKGAPICPWDSTHTAQMLCLYLIWMWEVIWDRCQPQTWCNGIIVTPQVTEFQNIWGQLGQWNGIRVHTYPWDSIPKVQTLCIFLIWMWEADWVGWQPQTWHNGIIYTPQVKNSQIWVNLASIMV